MSRLTLLGMHMECLEDEKKMIYEMDLKINRKRDEIHIEEMFDDTNKKATIITISDLKYTQNKDWKHEETLMSCQEYEKIPFHTLMCCCI